MTDSNKENQKWLRESLEKGMFTAGKIHSLVGNDGSELGSICRNCERY